MSVVDREGRLDFSPHDRVRVREREAEKARCPFCHADVLLESEAFLVCARCRSPQHEACFREAGACAACLSRKVEQPLAQRRRLSRRLLFEIAILGFLVGTLVALRQREALPKEFPGLYDFCTGTPSPGEPGSVSDPGLAAVRAAAKRHVETAAALAEKGDVDGAIARLTRAIELDPENEDAWRERGWLRGKKADIDGTIADETRAIVLDPRDWRAWRNRAWATRLRSGYRDDLKRAKELAPNDEEREKIEALVNPLLDFRRGGTPVDNDPVRKPVVERYKGSWPFPFD